MKAEKRHIRFIVNPRSGTSSKSGFDRLAQKHIDTALFSYDIVRTAYAGHATVLAAEAAATGVDICVAVGGDGTVNEVASSLRGTTTALGIVPCGSGNGLARHLCLPMSMKGALEIINRGETDTFDYGLINGRPFFCTCGMGFDAHVSQLFAESGKRGLATYARMVVQEGIRYKPTAYDITVEDGEGQSTRTEAFLIACANAAQYGNNTYIAPGASMQDGLLDVMIIRHFNIIGGPRVLMEMFTKTLRHNSHVMGLSARRLHIRRPEAGAAHIDGDPVSLGTDIDIEVCPRGLRCVVNPKVHEDSAKPNVVVDTLSKIIP